MVAALVAPPRPASDVCPLCHSWREEVAELCESCMLTGAGVGFPVGPPSVITLYTKPSALRDWLTRYKGRPGDDADPFDPVALARVRAILGRYLIEHGGDLSRAIGPVDCITTVPSGRNRPLPHPLESLVASLSLSTPVETMLVRGSGELDFRRPSPAGYTAQTSLPARRVLLVDDVFVTGARLFSAARALIDAGHTVAGTLVIARRVNRDWGDCRTMWDRQSALGFTWVTSPYTVTTDRGLLTRLHSAHPSDENGLSRNRSTGPSSDLV